MGEALKAKLQGMDSDIAVKNMAESLYKLGEYVADNGIEHKLVTEALNKCSIKLAKFIEESIPLEGKYAKEEQKV